MVLGLNYFGENVIMKNNFNRMRNYGMQYKELAKFFSLVISASTMDNENNKTPAFSLGEMIIVLLIMSLIAIGIPGIHFKKTEVKTKRTLHGRYECFYDNGTLMEYSVNEEGAATGPNAVGTCTFIPPKDAVFYLVHAVGGGGGAASGTGSIVTGTDTEEHTYNSPNEFPRWLRDVQGANEVPQLADGVKTYKTRISGAYAKVNYSASGQPGKTASMFFPRLRNVEITMHLGKGGALGQPGTETTVDFVIDNPNGTTTNMPEIIIAEGGEAGTAGTGTTTFWLGNEGAMCNIKENGAVGFREPEFSSNVELDLGSPMESMMGDVKFGAGGSGAYGNATGAASTSVTYEVSADGGVTWVDVSDFVKELRCRDPLVCPESGTVDGVCTPSGGKDGAVVILW